MKRIGGAVSPLLVLALTALWLLLNQTLAPGQIVLGARPGPGACVVGFSAAAACRRALRRFDFALALALVVLMDIVRSNLAVARLVLGLVSRSEVRSGFVHIPLDFRDPHGLAALAMIVTSTPGTVWAGLSPAAIRSLCTCSTSRMKPNGFG